MDDFNGKFCKNGSFPVIRAVSDCFKKKVNPSCFSEMKNCFNCFKLKIKNIEENNYNINNINFDCNFNRK